MTRPAEIDWLYRGLRLLLPAQWERFRAAVPPSLRDGNLVEAYRQLMEDPDPAVRHRAAHEWCTWEDAAIAHEHTGTPGQYSAKPDTAKLAFVRICTHYFARHGWLTDGQLLRDAHRLAGIPGVLIHGRLDLSAPLLTAWELARAWPDAELIVIEDSGHTRSPAMRSAIAQAVSRFTSGSAQPAAHSAARSSSSPPKTASSPGTIQPMACIVWRTQSLSDTTAIRLNAEW